MASTFPGSVDVFKSIPTPTTTPTNKSDASNDTLSARLQQHSDALFAVENYIIGSAVFSVLNFGADRTGVSDSSAAIQNAINAMPATGGGSLHFPSGFYKVSTTIVLNKAGTYFGDGPAIHTTAEGTFIRTASPVNTVFSIQSDGVRITMMGFDTSVTRTNGWYIDCPVLSSQNYIDHFTMDGHIYGINVNWGIGEVAFAYMTNCVPASGINIRLTYAGDVQINNIVTRGFTGNALYGIELLSNGGCSIDHCDIQNNVVGLIIAATAGVTIDGIFVSNSYFDVSGSIGVQIVASGAGATVIYVQFNNVWIATAVNGFETDTVSGGIIQSLLFSNCFIFHNSGNGVAINDSGANRIRFTGCDINGNSSHGIVLAPNVSGISVVGCTVWGNTGYGIVVNGGGNSEIIIVANDFTGNGTGEIAGNPVSGVIANNM